MQKKEKNNAYFDCRSSAIPSRETMNSAFVQPVSHDGRFLLGQCYKEYYKKTSQQRFIYVHDGDKESTPPRPRLVYTENSYGGG